MLVLLQENGKKTWTFHVMQLVCINGFGEVWSQQGVGDVGAFLCISQVWALYRYRDQRKV